MRTLLSIALAAVILVVGCTQSNALLSAQSNPTARLVVEKLDEPFEALAIYKGTIIAPPGTRIFNNNFTNAATDEDGEYEFVLTTWLGGDPSRDPSTSAPVEGVQYLLFYPGLYMEGFVPVSQNRQENVSPEQNVLLPEGTTPLAKGEKVPLFTEGDPADLKIGVME